MIEIRGRGRPISSQFSLVRRFRVLLEDIIFVSVKFSEVIVICLIDFNAAIDEDQ
jgi:hypothetical protein